LFGLPPSILLLLGVHVLIGATCLFFGLRLKRSFRWVLLLVAGIEMLGVAIIVAMALGSAH
jgi:hypothetical protein